MALFSLIRSETTCQFRFPWLFSLTLLFLLISPGSAKWKREDYCDSTGTRHTPFSTVETRQMRAATNDYITREDLQEFGRQMNNSWDRLGGVDHSTFNDFEFPNEVDVVFRIHMGIKSNEPVLKDVIFNKNLRNGKLITVQMITVNQPFVDSVPPTASAVRKFADDITNRTSRPGDVYWWVGGQIMDFNLTKSRVRQVSGECSEFEIHHPDGSIERIAWFFLVSDTDKYTVYIFPSEHGSPLCGLVEDRTRGDSLFLKDHGDLSQRLIRSSSDHLSPNYPGTIHEIQMNSGKSSPSKHYVNDTKNSHNEVYFRDVQRAWSDYYGTQKWTEQRSLWLKAESEFESALAAYDNFGFLLLSITALVSSTIVAVVTVKKATIGELAVVFVELIVIILFLYVLSHALVVFSRGDDYVVDYEIRHCCVYYRICQCHSTTFESLESEERGLDSLDQTGRFVFGLNVIIIILSDVIRNTGI